MKFLRRGQRFTSGFQNGVVFCIAKIARFPSNRICDHNSCDVLCPWIHHSVADSSLCRKSDLLDSADWNCVSSWRNDLHFDCAERPWVQIVSEMDIAESKSTAHNYPFITSQTWTGFVVVCALRFANFLLRLSISSYCFHSCTWHQRNVSWTF